MTLKELPVGAKFKTPFLKKKRRVLTKIRNIGSGSHPLTKQEIPGGAQYIQHDEKGETIFIPHCEVKNSSGRRFDMQADTIVMQIF